MNNDKPLTPPQVTLPSGKVIQRKVFSQYSIEELSDIISECDNFSHIIRVMKINSVYHNKIKKIVENNNISTSHFKIQYKRTTSNDSEIRSKTTFKRKLLNEGKLINKCAICNMDPIWNNKPITLQLDHINGISTDNRIENLRLLCPNCHSQTDTYTGRNIKKTNKLCSNNQTKNINIKKKKEKNINCLNCTNLLSKNNSTGYCIKCYRTSDIYKEIIQQKEKKQYNCKKCGKSKRQETSTGCCIDCYSEYKKKHNIISKEKTIQCAKCNIIVNTYNTSKLCKTCYFSKKKENMISKNKNCTKCNKSIEYRNKSNLCFDCYKNNINYNQIIIPTVLEIQPTNDKTISNNHIISTIIPSIFDQIPPVNTSESYNCNKCNNEITKKSKTGACQICYKKSLRTVERPSYEVLMNEINENGYLQTGIKYGVSDNSIRKWVKNYEKT